MDTLGPELLRYLIPFLPLTSLIAARGVSNTWRTIALTAPLHPARKSLLDLYLAAIIHPNFPSLVAEIQPRLHEFDRKAYIADLACREPGCVLPDLFEIWILEWPSKAIHFWAWPGLERKPNVRHPNYHLEINSLVVSSPTIDTIPVPKSEMATSGNQTCRGLALWEDNFGNGIGVQLWLVVDGDEQINDRKEGRLIWTSTGFVEGTGDPGSKKILRVIPFGSYTEYKLINFLDMLNVSRYGVEFLLDRLFDENYH